MRTTDSPPTPPTVDAPAVALDAVRLERRGRWWLVGAFLLCPCHLPWTLAALGAVLAGTSLGVALRDHAVLAGAVITTAWIAGTARGLRLVRLAERGGGACRTRPDTPTGIG
jgi:hypothetical protein